MEEVIMNLVLNVDENLNDIVVGIFIIVIVLDMIEI